MRNFIKLFLTSLVILAISSCGYTIQNPFKKKDDQARIRIVDLQGKPRAVKTYIPSENIGALKDQGRFIKARENNKSFSSGKDFVQDSHKAPNAVPIIEQDVYKQVSKMPVVKKSDVKIAAGNDGGETPEIQYDLAKDYKSPVKPRKKVVKKLVNKTSKKGIFVQTGAFRSHSNAKKSLAKMKKFHRGSVQKRVRNKKTTYRVLLGPFSSRVKANQVVGKIKKAGHDAIVVRNQ